VAAIVGAAIVLAAGLLAAAVVIAGGDGPTSSTTAAKTSAAGHGKRRRPSEGRGSTDPVLPAARTECETGVYVAERVAGTPYTSCPFAHEVARAFVETGQGRSFGAYSPITGETYEMTCKGVETSRCTDGDSAVVYLIPAAISSSPSSTVTPPEDDTSSTSSADLGDWPGGSGYTAMLGAFSSEWRARNFQSEALEKGLEAGVLYSSNFSSLRPGYWVVFSGDFAGSDEAAGRAGEARRLGYSDSYPRLVAP
jgi:hypothetical protein